MPYDNYNHRVNRNQDTQVRADYNNDIPNDLADFSANAINDLAEKSCKEVFSRNIKTNQIRNFFSHINTIQMSYKKARNEYNSGIERDLILLKPKLAYAAGRQNRNQQESYKQFTGLLSKAIDSVVSSKEQKIALCNFFALVEAIVAYHKFYGGD